MKKRNPYLTVGLVMTGILTALIGTGVVWKLFDHIAISECP